MRVGQRVTLDNLKNISEPYDEIYNPKNLERTIVNTDAKLCPIEVRWDNSIRNSYYEYNLKIVFSRIIG